MDLKQIFLLLSQKGIDNVNLEMMPFDQRKDIYEKYAEMFNDHTGVDAAYIVVKSYAKAKNLKKAKERLLNEMELAAMDKKYKYCYFCALLLDNNEMASFFVQFIAECLDKDVDYNS